MFIIFQYFNISIKVEIDISLEKWKISGMNSRKIINKYWNSFINRTLYSTLIIRDGANRWR